jgi:hypothetical protein
LLPDHLISSAAFGRSPERSREISIILLPEIISKDYATWRGYANLLFMFRKKALQKSIPPWDRFFCMIWYTLCKKICTPNLGSKAEVTCNFHGVPEQTALRRVTLEIQEQKHPWRGQNNVPVLTAKPWTCFLKDTILAPGWRQKHEVFKRLSQ